VTIGHTDSDSPRKPRRHNGKVRTAANTYVDPSATITQQQLDVMRLGPQVAAVKYSLPAKRWRKLVQQA
jgi:hypothetical protein